MNYQEILPSEDEIEDFFLKETISDKKRKTQYDSGFADGLEKGIDFVMNFVKNKIQLQDIPKIPLDIILKYLANKNINQEDAKVLIHELYKNREKELVFNKNPITPKLDPMLGPSFTNICYK